MRSGGRGSLIGVIVSHVIVLLDFIEEQHERGENLPDALIDASIVRIGPVLFTIPATALGLFVGSPRRAAVGGALLCADRRAIVRNTGDPVHRPGHLLDLCAGSEGREMARSLKVDSNAILLGSVQARARA